jgi:hypothetical protein
MGRILKQPENKEMLATAARELKAMATALPLFSAEWMPAS